MTKWIFATIALPTLAACATSQTQVMPAYRLANGHTLQDVVSIGADPTGGAPVVTSLVTYDVARPGEARAVAHATASAPGTGQLIAAGLARAATGAAVAAALHGGLGAGSGTTVNATLTTSGNTATNGDAGDIDAQVVVCPGLDPACSPSN